MSDVESVMELGLRRMVEQLDADVDAERQAQRLVGIELDKMYSGDDKRLVQLTLGTLYAVRELNEMWFRMMDLHEHMKETYDDDPVMELLSLASMVKARKDIALYQCELLTVCNQACETVSKRKDDDE